MDTPILIVYASRFGSTRAIAERIGKVIADTGIAVDVRAAAEAGQIDGYRAVVIGSTVEAGRWLPDATSFVERHRAALAARPVWLFSSGPLGDRAVHAPQPDPKELASFRRRIAPRDHRVFAGSFDRATASFDGMGLVERTVVRRFLPDGDWRDWPAIEAWAGGIARALAAEPVAVGPRA